MRKIHFLLACLACAPFANAECYIAGDFSGWNKTDEWTMNDQGDGTYVLENVTIPKSQNKPTEGGGFKIVFDGQWLGYGYESSHDWKLVTTAGINDETLYSGAQSNIFVPLAVACEKIIFNANTHNITVIPKGIRITAAPTTYGESTTGHIRVSMSSAMAVMSQEGTVIKYRIGELGETQTYSPENEPVLGEGESLTSWIETSDNQKYEETTVFPYVVAFAQPISDHWSRVAIHLWNNTFGTTWPGIRLTPELFSTQSSSKYFSLYTFLGTSYDNGYLIDGEAVNCLFNDNDFDSKSPDLLSISKIYTCFDTDGTDVTDTIGGELSGVETVAGGNVKVSAGQGVIAVEGAADVTVYTTGGALVSRKARTEAPAGIYIVRADGNAEKVIVR